MPRYDNSDRGGMISRESMQRIQRAVSAYERNVDIHAKPLRTAADDGGESIRLGKITGTWGKGTTATVTRLKGNGLAWSPADETFEAKNFFTDISVDCGERKVACADVGGTWILIAAEC